MNTYLYKNKDTGETFKVATQEVDNIMAADAVASEHFGFDVTKAHQIVVSISFQGD